MRKFLAKLDNKNVFYALLTLNFIASAIIFYCYRRKLGGDYGTYWALAEGIPHGRYSFWWYLSGYLPDTFRNPGYPLFICLITSIYHSIFAVQLVQLILYFLTIILAVKVLDKYGNGYIIKNLFLLILLPNLQIAISTPHISPDSTAAFFIMLLIYVEEKMENGWFKYILLGLITGVIFQLRAIFLLFPFFKAIADFFLNRKQFSFVKHSVLIITFLLTTLPYGYWNYKNNGVFKITSLEGGAGVMYNGYWNLKIPNYTTSHYWVGNKTAEEIIPFVKDTNQIKKNIIAYNREWEVIDSACAIYNTHFDTMMQKEMYTYSHLMYITHNPKYTLEREKLLKHFAIKHFMEEPLYTIESRIYTAIRIWITNVSPSSLRKAGFAGKIALLYPFVVCSIVFFASIIFIILAYRRKKITLNETLILLAPIIYFGIIHLPFGLQARYTIPVRMLLFMLLAISIIKLAEVKGKVIIIKPLLS